MKPVQASFLAVVMLAGGASQLPGQQRLDARNEFTWSETVAQGAWIRVQNHKGSIDVQPASGNAVEVRARAESSSNAEDVRFEIVRDGQNVTICALASDSERCESRGIRGGSERDQTPAIAFTVLVPRGVKAGAGSGNGKVTVRGISADVSASSGNGDVSVRQAGGAVNASSGNGDIDVEDARGPVEVSTGNGSVRVTAAEGTVEASSGNGSIDVSLASLRQTGDMRFSTGNGRVTVRLPESFQGQIDAHTGHGGVTSDFPIMMRGSMSPNRIMGTIGQGGPRIELASGNGRLELLRNR